jgi:hypothetical protein
MMCRGGGTCPKSTSRQADIIFMLEWRDMSNVYKWTGDIILMLGWRDMSKVYK